MEQKSGSSLNKGLPDWKLSKENASREYILANKDIKPFTILEVQNIPSR
jgi:hypothetical protein